MFASSSFPQMWAKINSDKSLHLVRQKYSQLSSLNQSTLAINQIKNLFSLHMWCTILYKLLKKQFNSSMAEAHSEDSNLLRLKCGSQKMRRNLRKSVLMNVLLNSSFRLSSTALRCLNNTNLVNTINKAANQAVPILNIRIEVAKVAIIIEVAVVDKEEEVASVTIRAVMSRVVLQDSLSLQGISLKFLNQLLNRCNPNIVCFQCQQSINIKLLNLLLISMQESNMLVTTSTP